MSEKGTIKWWFKSIDDAVEFQKKLERKYSVVVALQIPIHDDSGRGWYVWGVKND